MALHVSDVTHPSSGGSAPMLFGLITCVGCALTACGEPQPARSQHILRTELHQTASVQSLLKMGESRLDHAEAVNPNKQTKKSVSKLVLIH
jgi:hypothetical protein